MARFGDTPRARTHSAVQFSKRIGSIWAEDRRCGINPAKLSTYCNGQCRFG
jgi:hypothetical protein